MQIFGATNVTSGNVQKIQQVNTKTQTTDSSSVNSPSIDTVDQLDISSEAKMLSQLKVVGDIRADRVADIRAQIESGVYETNEKLDVAVSRLLNELA